MTVIALAYEGTHRDVHTAGLSHAAVEVELEDALRHVGVPKACYDEFINLDPSDHSVEELIFKGMHTNDIVIPITDDTDLTVDYTHE